MTDQENEIKEYRVRLSGYVEGEAYVEAQSLNDAESTAEYLSVSDIVHNGGDIDFSNVLMVDAVEVA
tara:strand:- start:6627 stop:6827 length:201 start_codon:yes stop_codon:yes gene_type:complete